jgi:hypothetical protein
MPASKVRKKAKNRIAAERKRLHEQDRRCADSCCGRDAPVVTGTPLPTQAYTPAASERR